MSWRCEHPRRSCTPGSMARSKTCLISEVLILWSHSLRSSRISSYRKNFENLLGKSESHRPGPSLRCHNFGKVSSIRIGSTIQCNTTFRQIRKSLADCWRTLDIKEQSIRLSKGVDPAWHSSCEISSPHLRSWQLLTITQEKWKLARWMLQVGHIFGTKHCKKKWTE